MTLYMFTKVLFMNCCVYFIRMDSVHVYCHISLNVFLISYNYTPKNDGLLCKLLLYVHFFKSNAYEFTKTKVGVFQCKILLST